MHTNFLKGTTIWIRFKTKETTTGKFANHKSGKVLLEDSRTISLKDVTAMSARKLK